jgi:hypothetical protein
MLAFDVVHNCIKGVGCGRGLNALQKHCLAKACTDKIWTRVEQ